MGGQVLVTLGQRGSILFDQNQKMVHQSSFNVDNVVDTTGAGNHNRPSLCILLTTQPHYSTTYLTLLRKEGQGLEELQFNGYY